MKFIKSTAVLIEDAPPLKDPMTVDYRVRCVIHSGQVERLFYGITANEYNSEMSPVPPTDVAYHEEYGARNVHDKFDHSEGRGRRPTKQRRRHMEVTV